MTDLGAIFKTEFWLNTTAGVFIAIALSEAHLPRLMPSWSPREPPSTTEHKNQNLDI